MWRSRTDRRLLLLLCVVGCGNDNPGAFPDADDVCGFDTAREALRANSADIPALPEIDAVEVNRVHVWKAGDANPLNIRPGDEIALHGRGFGAGPDVDFAKIMIGNSRVLETDLAMYEQRLDIFTQVNYETPAVHSRWNKDVLNWSDSEIRFRVPVHVSRGPLVVQVQKRTGYNESLRRPGEPHLVIDALTARITDPRFIHDCDVVSTLDDAVRSQPIAVIVDNPGFDELVTRGRQVFWAYDFNIGAAHAVRGLDWTRILSGRAVDPLTGAPADPLLLFGALAAMSGEVPADAIDDVRFDPYPQPSPIPGFLTVAPPLADGNTRSTGFVGYRYAEANHPLEGRGEWIGFNCVSCHGHRITYERSPGETVTRVFPGLPNPAWSMKWTLLDDFEGIDGEEDGPPLARERAFVDKTALIYSVPQGCGEHNIVRRNGDGSETANDYQFSPIAIPNVTAYMPIRRPLSHTESYVGFEGSYIHSQEPDGATGSMRAEWLQALTAYMTTLDEHDDDLRNVGLYRWLDARGLLAEQAGDVSEGQFVHAGWRAFPGVVTAVERGEAIFARDCRSCHADTLGTHTNENMMRLDEVGRFFAPTIYHKETQAIRVSFLRNLYWVQLRGLLSDGHIRNLEDLVDPDRVTVGTPLYDQYYTLHPPAVPAPGSPDAVEPYPPHNRRGDVFRVPISPTSSPDDAGARRNRFVERHKYFTTVPWDEGYYYWDYQTFRTDYGPDELGARAPINLPAAPHPWPAASREDIADLVEYLLSL